MKYLVANQFTARFRGPYHPACRVLNFWLLSVGWWKLKDYVHVIYSLKFASCSSTQYKQICPSIKIICCEVLSFSTDNWHGSRKCRVLTCEINAIFNPRVILNTFSHFCLFMVVWGLGLGSWIRFVGLGFSVGWVWGLWSRAFPVIWALYINIEE